MNNIIDDKNFKHIRFDTSDKDTTSFSMSNLPDDLDVMSPKSAPCDNSLPNLKDKTLYQNEIDVCIASILNAYVILCQTYLSEVFDHIKLKDENTTHQRNSTEPTSDMNVEHNMKVYIILKGLDLVKVVFTSMMLYSRNLLVACQTARNAMLLYFEFITQINSNNYEYLQLSVRDTTLFVYKKTLFNIDIETKNAFVASPKDNSYHVCIRSFAELVTNITNNFIYEYDNPKDINDNIIQLKACLTNINTQFSKILVMDICDEDIISIVKNATVINEKINMLGCLLGSVVVTSFDKASILINILSFMKHKFQKSQSHNSTTQFTNPISSNDNNQISICNELIQRILSNYEKLSNDNMYCKTQSYTIPIVDYVTKQLVKKA